MNTDLAFFPPRQGALLEAIVERLFPADELGPGAAALGVLTYIDRALAGPYRDLQATYRRGLAALDSYAEGTCGQRFVDLDPARQDAILAAVEEGRATGFEAPSGPAFFDLLLQHTREGLFGDPLHGGNRDERGWGLLGYPGVRAGFSAEEQFS